LLDAAESGVCDALDVLGVAGGTIDVLGVAACSSLDAAVPRRRVTQGAIDLLGVGSACSSLGVAAIDLLGVAMP